MSASTTSRKSITRYTRKFATERDTTTAQGRLVFHMFGALAEFERSLIRERTQAGLAAARRAGRTRGRPPKLTDAQQAEARKRRAEGATLIELARSYGVGKSTISRL